MVVGSVPTRTTRSSVTRADPKKPSSDRVVNIDRLEFTPDGKLRVKGPTRSPQPLPSEATASVADLRCEFMKTPLGIDDLQPALSWTIRDERRGVVQSASLIHDGQSRSPPGKRLLMNRRLWRRREGAVFRSKLPRGETDVVPKQLREMVRIRQADRLAHFGDGERRAEQKLTRFLQLATDDIPLGRDTQMATEQLQDMGAAPPNDGGEIFDRRR